MEILVSVISIALLLLLILVPVFLFIRVKKQKSKNSNFFLYLFLGIVISSVIILFSAWWMHYSSQLLLKSYGYDFDAMNDLVRFSNVATKNIERINNLKRLI